MSNESVSRFEQRSREVFEVSVACVDMPTRSRLTQARHVALASVSATPRYARMAFWVPALGASAALVLGVAMWMSHASTDTLSALSDNRSGLEDLEVVASNDQLELLQDDLEFYDWADKAAVQESAGKG